MQIQQTRYSDPLASTIDPRYSGGFTERPGALFSPIALAVKANPTDTAGVTLRAEYDAKRGLLETFQLAGNVTAGSWLSSSGGWSRSLYVANVLDPTVATPRNYLRSESKLTFGRRQVGGSYAFDLNLSDRTLVQQRLGLFYSAQCCGLALDYQTFNYGEQRGRRGDAGPPRQRLVHAGRARFVLERARRIRHRPERHRHVARSLTGSTIARQARAAHSASRSRSVGSSGMSGAQPVAARILSRVPTSSG